MKNNRSGLLSLETDRLKFRQWQESDFEQVARFFNVTENAEFLGGRRDSESSWRLITSVFPLGGLGFGLSRIIGVTL